MAVLGPSTLFSLILPAIFCGCTWSIFPDLPIASPSGSGGEFHTDLLSLSMPSVVEEQLVVEEPSVMEEPSVEELFYLDCFDHHAPLLASQLMDFTPVMDSHIVDCTGVSSYLPDDLINCPTPAAYNTALDGGIRDFINNNPSGISDCFPVIFNMGAGLAITPSRNDFTGPITPIPSLCLGGMANGMLIERKGMIQWSFRTQSATVIAKSECYLVPDCLV